MDFFSLEERNWNGICFFSIALGLLLVSVNGEIIDQGKPQPGNENRLEKKWSISIFFQKTTSILHTYTVPVL